MSAWDKFKQFWLSPDVETKASDNFIPADQEFPGFLPSTRFPYTRAVGKGLDSNVLMSPVMWVARNFTEAEPVVQRRDPDHRWRAVPGHDLGLLLERPNNFYNGDQLWQASLISYLLDGNAYWLKVRNEFGGVVQLWYLPHFLVEPKFDRESNAFIDHYDYRPAATGDRLKLPVRDVVHIRMALDPRNTRKGFSPLRPLLREIFADEEAANFSASILRNMGVPGGLIAPKDASSLPTPDDVQRMKDYMKTGFTGDKRGEWLVLGTPTITEQFGFDPSQLMLTNLRDVTEERVCAMIGLPAAVVGFGAGLQQTKVGATMRELRKLAWVSMLQPNQKNIGGQVTQQLMPDFQAQTRRFRLHFDVSNVAAFVEEEMEKSRRIALLVDSGIITVAVAQEMLGLEVDDSQDVYLRPSSSPPQPEGEEPAPIEPASVNGGPPDRIEDDSVVTRADRLLEHWDKTGGTEG